MRQIFAECAIDTASREVWRQGQPVHLSLKAYELLVYLLNARPRAVSKEELYQALWPDTLVVEANLPNLVAEIRMALGDPARTPRIIRTVHGYGYAFLADVLAEAVEDARPASGFWLVAGGREWLLSHGTNLVGRGRDVQVRLDAPSVSRHHARLTVAGELVTVEDLGSKNGTTVNRRRVEGPVPVVDGDLVIFGSVQARLRMSSPGAATETLSLGSGS